MKKRLGKFFSLATLTTAGIYCVNRLFEYSATSKNILDTKGSFYNWKNGDVYYSVHGTGSPILLIHDFKPESSSIEWYRVIQKLSKNNKVYVIDLPGCGRSDKPSITYTNYYFVQFIHDFIDEIIKEPTTIIASGASSSFCIMNKAMHSEQVEKIVAINPEIITGKKYDNEETRVVLKHLLDLPIYGTFAYHVIMNRKEIANKLKSNYFINKNSIPNKLDEAYTESASLGEGRGRHLLSSIQANYTGVDMKHVLPKIDNLYLIGNRDKSSSRKILDSYTRCNPNIETTLISSKGTLPQLDAPDKFIEIIQMILKK